MSCHDEVDFSVVDIRHDGDAITVNIPPLLADESGRRGVAIDLGFVKFSVGDARTRGLRLEMTLPERASLVVRTKSGDVRVDGPGSTARLRTGSGDITLDAADEVEATLGSGDLGAGTLGRATVQSGSGDLTVDALARGGTLRSGSGDIRVTRASGDLEVFSGSGDLTVGRFDGATVTLRAASGDITVGVPEGVPVWQDVHTGSGDLHSSLAAVGQPAEGELYVTVRATTGSGDIELRNA